MSFGMTKYHYHQAKEPNRVPPRGGVHTHSRQVWDKVGLVVPYGGTKVKHDVHFKKCASMGIIDRTSGFCYNLKSLRFCIALAFPKYIILGPI